MGISTRHVALVALVSFVAVSARAEDAHRAKFPTNLDKTPTRFYDIYSKLDEDTIREAAARLTAVAKDYYRRTSGLGRIIKSRLPIYLFDNRQDFLDAGGSEGFTGFFTGKAVLAIYTLDNLKGMWGLLQHECWHQFARQSVGGRWPPWLEEGMGDYYMHAIWTGDGFITGVIPRYRLDLVQSRMREKAFKTIEGLLSTDRTTWNQEGLGKNYDQAWALVQYLAHGATERHRAALVDLIRDASLSRPGLDSFRKAFGPRYSEIWTQCEQWWISLKSDALSDPYNRATVATMTSFLARAHLRDLKFKSADEFFAAAKDGKLLTAAQATRPLWLPKSLLDDHLKNVGQLQKWTLVTAGRNPELRLQQDDGATLVGKFDFQPATGVSVLVRSAKDKE